jgi:hypothetical protein
MLITKGEDVFQPIDSGVTFYDTFGDLPSGIYVIRRAVDSDIHKEVLSYASLETNQQEILISLDKILNLEGVFFNMGKMRILGGYPRMPLRYLFDLDNQNAFQFAICNDQHPVEPSPSGRRLALICTKRGEIHDGKVVIEIISLEDGMDYYLQIPYQSNKRNASNKIFWVSDESFIAMVGPIEEPCLINITNPSMKCARALEGKPIQAVSNSWLVVNRSRGYRWIIDIHLMECFTDQSKCDTVATFDHEELGSASFHWAPNASMLGVIFSADMGSGNTKVGYYDTEVWEYHQIVELPGDYLFVDWCPDSSCLLVRENAQTTGYLVYIDKHLEPLAPDGFPMKLIEIP